MKPWQNFLRPQSIEDALRDLQDAPAPACVIAGGTDLLLELQQGNHPPVHTLVDLTSIRALQVLEVRGEDLFIGAAVPVSRLADSPLVHQHAEALAEACALIAGPQVRNVATLGGNVAHALPAADGTIALMCLDVQAEVADMSGLRRVRFQDLFLGAGRSALQPGREIITGFYIPLQHQGQASAFRRVMRMQGIALPVLNVSLWLERSGESIGKIRVAAGPSGPTPRRLETVEAVLCGKNPDNEVIATAREALLDEVSFRTSPHRATAGYRQHLSGVLMAETLTLAWERSGKVSEAVHG